MTNEVDAQAIINNLAAKIANLEVANAVLKAQLDAKQAGATEPSADLNE